MTTADNKRSSPTKQRPSNRKAAAARNTKKKVCIPPCVHGTWTLGSGLRVSSATRDDCDVTSKTKLRSAEGFAIKAGFRGEVVQWSHRSHSSAEEVTVRWYPEQEGNSAHEISVYTTHTGRDIERELSQS